MFWIGSAVLHVLGSIHSIETRGYIALLDDHVTLVMHPDEVVVHKQVIDNTLYHEFCKKKMNRNIGNAIEFDLGDPDWMILQLQWTRKYNIM